MLENELNSFKKLILEADKRAIKNQSIVEEKDVKSIKSKFERLYLLFDDLIRSEQEMSPEIEQKFGNIFQREMLPYILLTEAGERFYSKPRGYAGDYYTMETIYQNNPRGSGRLGCVLDSCFLDLPAAQAARNRRGVFVKEIKKVLEKTNNGQVNIMSIASGPANRSKIYLIFWLRVTAKPNIPVASPLQFLERYFSRRSEVREANPFNIYCDLPLLTIL